MNENQYLEENVNKWVEGVAIIIGDPMVLKAGGFLGPMKPQLPLEGWAEFPRGRRWRKTFGVEETLSSAHNFYGE